MLEHLGFEFSYPTIGGLDDALKASVPQASFDAIRQASVVEFPLTFVPLGGRRCSAASSYSLWVWWLVGCCPRGFCFHSGLPISVSWVLRCHQFPRLRWPSAGMSRCSGSASDGIPRRRCPQVSSASAWAWWIFIASASSSGVVRPLQSPRFRGSLAGLRFHLPEFLHQAVMKSLVLTSSEFSVKDPNQMAEPPAYG